MRTGSGAVSVASAAAGTLEVLSGSGSVRAGIAPGTDAEIDLSSGSGRVDSELAVAEEPPPGDVPLRVHARSGSGDVLVTRTR